MGKMREFFRNAFALGGDPALTHDEEALLNRIAEGIHRRGLALPASVFLESTRPLNFLGSQVLVGLQPFIDLVASSKEHERLAQALEKRSSVDFLLARLESGSPNEK